MSPSDLPSTTSRTATDHTATRSIISAFARRARRTFTLLTRRALDFLTCDTCDTCTSNPVYKPDKICTKCTLEFVKTGVSSRTQPGLTLYLSQEVPTDSSQSKYKANMREATAKDKLAEDPSEAKGHLRFPCPCGHWSIEARSPSDIARVLVRCDGVRDLGYKYPSCILEVQPHKYSL